MRLKQLFFILVVALKKHMFKLIKIVITFGK